MAGMETDMDNLTGLADKYNVEEKRLRLKQRNVEHHFVQKMSKIRDSGDSVLAEVYNSLTGYIDGDEDKLGELVEELNEPIQNYILKSHDYFTTEKNLENKLRRTAEFIVKNYPEDEILGFIIEFRLKAVTRKREKLIWKAYELKRSVSCPGLKFQEKPDLSAIDREAMKSFAVQLRERLKKYLCHEDEHVEVRYALVDKFVILSALKSKRIHVEQATAIIQLYIWFCALNPEFPYLCVHGDWGEDEKENLNILAKCHPSGEYQIAHDLKLMDEGLNVVYLSLLKVPSSVVKETDEFRSRILPPALVSPVLPLPTNATTAAKIYNEQVLNCLVNDGQSGGFKTLTLEYKKADCPVPIICKMEALEGTLDENIAELHNSGAWSDPSPYLVAKDEKTNHLRLEHDGQKWVPSPATAEED